MAKTYGTPVYSADGVIAAPHYLASLAGIDVLRDGGSAVDAALGLCRAVTGRRDVVRLRGEFSLSQVLHDRTGAVRLPAAVLISMTDGPGGVAPVRREFVHRVRQMTRELRIPLVVNETGTDAGRTGTWFAFEQYGHWHLAYRLPRRRFDHSRPVTIRATVSPIVSGDSKVARTALGSNPQCTMQSWQRGLPLLRPYRDQSVSSISSRNVRA